MEVVEHRFIDDHLPNHFLDVSFILPSLASFLKRDLSIYIVFVNDSPRIPIMGLQTNEISMPSTRSQSSSLLQQLAEHFKMFRRDDFLDSCTVQANDVLRIDFKPRFYDQLGVRFTFRRGSSFKQSSYHLMCLDSVKILTIFAPMSTFFVLDYDGFRTYNTKQLIPERLKFFCSVCFEESLPMHKMVLLGCGHMICDQDVVKLKPECPICLKPIVQENIVKPKLRDGFCPLDECEYTKENLHLLMPCRCVVSHNLLDMWKSTCPFEYCSSPIDFVIKMFSSNELS